MAESFGLVVGCVEAQELCDAAAALISSLAATSAAGLPLEWMHSLISSEDQSFIKEMPLACGEQETASDGLCWTLISLCPQRICRWFAVRGGEKKPRAERGPSELGTGCDVQIEFRLQSPSCASAEAKHPLEDMTRATFQDVFRARMH